MYPVLLVGCTSALRFVVVRAVVVMLVLEEERNIYDQRILEHALVMKDHSVTVVRKSLKDFEERGKLSEDKKLLM